MKEAFSILFVLSCVVGIILLIIHDVRNQEMSVSVYQTIEIWKQEYPELSPLVNKHIADKKIVSWEWREIAKKKREIEKEIISNRMLESIKQDSDEQWELDKSI